MDEMDIVRKVTHLFYMFRRDNLLKKDDHPKMKHRDIMVLDAIMKLNDGNLVKNASAGRIDYAWSKSTDDAKAIGELDNMTVNNANIRYTRCFYINQFPHEANIK